MPYGNPFRLLFGGGSASIEAGELTGKAFTNILRNSQLLTAPGWTPVDGATVAPVAQSSDLPVGGRTAFRVTDTSAVLASALEQVAAIPPTIDGDGSERPLIFSFYTVLEAYPQTLARAEALLTLANANTVLFSMNFNPRNGQIVSTAFTSTEPGFASAEASAFINQFEGENGVSAFRVSLIIFTRGLTGASAIASLRLRVYPDVADPTTIGGFLDITAAQIAIPFGTTTTVAFGLPPYRPTWDVLQPAQNAKLAANSLDLSYHLSPVSVTPYQLDYYGDLGAGAIVTLPGQDFNLPPTQGDIANGWWTIIGSPTAIPFDVVVAAGQTLVLGGATADVVGPATFSVTSTTILFWQLVKLDSGTFGLFSLLSDIASAVPPTPPTASVWQVGLGVAAAGVGIGYGNGRFIAAHTSGVFVSFDGIRWTFVLVAAGVSMGNVTYGNGLFVLVGQAAPHVWTSPDGFIWTPQVAASAQTWSDVAFGRSSTNGPAGLFVAVASSGPAATQVMTSPDGIVWTSRVAPGPPDIGFYGVAFGDNQFVMVSEAPAIGTLQIATSPDGITWTGRVTALVRGGRRVVYANGLWVAVSGNSASGLQVQTSPDGITWTARVTPPGNYTGITYGEGRFIIVDGTFGGIATSPDGITWTVQQTFTGPVSNWADCAYGNGVFSVVGTGGADLVTRSGTMMQEIPLAILASN